MPHIIHKSNFIALQKDNESYLFFYDDEDAEGVVRVMARFAAPDWKISASPGTGGAAGDQFDAFDQFAPAAPVQVFVPGTILVSTTSFPSPPWYVIVAVSPVPRKLLPRFAPSGRPANALVRPPDGLSIILN